MPTSMNAIAALPIVLLLSFGCASSGGSSGSGAWTKAGATEQDVNRDSLDCMRDARSVAGGPSGPRPQVDHTRYRRCMVDRGYDDTKK
jgi:hypothetical protein